MDALKMGYRKKGERSKEVSSGAQNAQNHHFQFGLKMGVMVFFFWGWSEGWTSKHTLGMTWARLQVCSEGTQLWARGSQEEDSLPSWRLLQSCLHRTAEHDRAAHSLSELLMSPGLAVQGSTPSGESTEPRPRKTSAPEVPPLAVASDCLSVPITVFSGLPAEPQATGTLARPGGIGAEPTRPSSAVVGAALLLPHRVPPRVLWPPWLCYATGFYWRIN